jgi:hypothetical protein
LNGEVLAILIERSLTLRTVSSLNRECRFFGEAAIGGFSQPSPIKTY